MSTKPKTGNSKSAQAARIEVGSTTKREVSEEEIRLRAYQKYSARRGAPGDSQRDWLEAERELRELQSRKEQAGLAPREMVSLKRDADSDPFC